MAVVAAAMLTIGGTSGHASAVAAQQWNGTTADLTLADGPSVEAMVTVGSDLYVAGAFDSAGGMTVANIARFDGQLWWPLGDPTTDGPVGTPVWALIAVGTDLYAGTDGTVWKYDTITQTWTDLASGGDMVINALAWYDDGSNPPYLVAGGFWMTGGCYLEYLDGPDWSGFSNVSYATGTPGNGGWNGCYIESLATMGTDLYVGGIFDQAGGVTAYGIAKYNVGGFTAVGSGGGNGVVEQSMTGIDAIPVGDVATMTVSPDGNSLLIGGGFTEVNGVVDASDPSAQTATGDRAENLAIWDGDTLAPVGGSDDPAVFPTVGDFVTDLMFAADGSLYMAGGTTFPDGGYGLGRLADTTGSDWASVGYGTDDDVLAIAELGDSIWAGGYFTSAYSDDAPTPVDSTATLARWGVPHVPAQVTAASITGSPVVGSTLKLQLTVTGSPAPTVTRQWMRCNAPVVLESPQRSAQPRRLVPDGCTPISGVTGTSYVVQSADVGKYIVVLVQASNSSGFALNFPATAVKVTAAPASTTTTVPAYLLPATGGHDTPLAWVALALVAGGAALLLVRRRVA